MHFVFKNAQLCIKNGNLVLKTRNCAGGGAAAAGGGISRLFFSPLLHVLFTFLSRLVALCRWGAPEAQAGRREYQILRRRPAARLRSVFDPL